MSVAYIGENTTKSDIWRAGCKTIIDWLHIGQVIEIGCTLLYECIL